MLEIVGLGLIALSFFILLVMISTRNIVSDLEDSKCQKNLSQDCQVVKSASVSVACAYAVG